MTSATLPRVIAPLLIAFVPPESAPDAAPVATAHELLDALRRIPVETLLLPILIQLGVILLAARAFAWLFRRLRQPEVIGEIAAGIVLGPSVLGALFPAAAAALFQPALHVANAGPEVQLLFGATVGSVLSMLAQLGLILLLFLVGLEFDIGHLRSHARSAAVISIAGMVLPFALGILLAWFLHARLDFAAEGPAVPQFVGFALFMGTAMSITALPVLGRMMLELNIARTRLGSVVIASAAMEDACGWILLAAVTAIVGGAFNLGQTLLMTAEMLAFALAMVYVVRPLLVRWTRSALERSGGELQLHLLALLLVLVFACAIVTNLIGIFSIFGPFLLGVVLSSESQLREAIGGRMRDFVTTLFLPIFFTYTGLRTEIGTLASVELWILCGLVLATAIFGKFVGCAAAARMTGFSPREAACVGGMMNTRGLMELVVVNVGYDLHVIPRSLFCMLVIMALVTTLMTTPLLLRFMRGTELETPIRQSGFLGNVSGPR